MPCLIHNIGVCLTKLCFISFFRDILQRYESSIVNRIYELYELDDLKMINDGMNDLLLLLGTAAYSIHISF